MSIGQYGAAAGVDGEALERVLEPVLRAHGAAAVDITFKPERGGWVLRVAVEREGSTEPGGGVNLDFCAAVSRDISTALDVADLIVHPYTLEVASPGVERPLRNQADFERFQGQLAKVTLREPAPDGQCVLRGQVAEVHDDQVTMRVDGNRVSFDLANIRHAHLVFEFGAKGNHSGNKHQRSGRAGRQSNGDGKGSSRAKARAVRTE